MGTGSASLVRSLPFRRFAGSQSAFYPGLNYVPKLYRTELVPIVDSQLTSGNLCVNCKQKCGIVITVFLCISQYRSANVLGKYYVYVPG